MIHNISIPHTFGWTIKVKVLSSFKKRWLKTSNSNTIHIFAFPDCALSLCLRIMSARLVSCIWWPVKPTVCRVFVCYPVIHVWIRVVVSCLLKIQYGTPNIGETCEISLLNDLHYLMLFFGLLSFYVGLPSLMSSAKPNRIFFVVIFNVLQLLWNPSAHGWNEFADPKKYLLFWCP